METVKTKNVDPVVRRGRARAALAISTFLMAAIGIALIATNIFGSIKFVSVLSDSMSPAVSSGSLAMVESVPASDVKEGDIVAVGLDSINDTRISRISSIESSGGGVYSYTLWADNAQIQDPWLHRTLGDVSVVVWSVPVVGWFVLVISNPIFVLAAVIGSIVYARYYTMRIFEYNSRQVHARRIAEERLENIKYGGLNDVVDMFAEQGGVSVKVGRSGVQKVESSDELAALVAEEEERMRIKNMGRTSQVEDVKEEGALL